MSEVLIKSTYLYIKPTIEIVRLKKVSRIRH